MTLIGEQDGQWDSGRVVVRWAARTDVGRHRRANEDSVAIAPPLFAVADGMGGHAAGDLASARAVTRLATVGEVERAHDGDVDIAVQVDEKRISAALDLAATDIDELSAELGIDAGTTATGLAVADDELIVFNVGDSRVYAAEGGRLSQLTVDHSLVQELVDLGELDPEEAEYHPAANVITRALGFREPPRPDLQRVDAREGMRVLVCSDGLTKEVDAERLRLLLVAGLAADVTADSLVEAALSAGGHDNVTVIVLDIVRVGTA